MYYSARTTVRLWDLNASVAAGSGLTLIPHPEGVTEVAFSPGGAHLATAGADGTVRIHVLDLEELIALAKSRLTRSLTTEECRQYLHLEDCPEE